MFRTSGVVFLTGAACVAIVLVSTGCGKSTRDADHVDTALYDCETVVSAADGDEVGIQLIVAQSASLEMFAGVVDSDRWDLTHEAIWRAIESLQASSTSTARAQYRVGLTLLQGAPSCAINTSIAPAPLTVAHVDTLLTAMDEVPPGAGDRDLARALRHGVEALAADPAQTKVAVLFADGGLGEASCSGQPELNELLSVAEQGRAQGVLTVPVLMPGGPESLDVFAQLGRAGNDCSLQDADCYANFSNRANYAEDLHQLLSGDAPPLLGARLCRVQPPPEQPGAPYELSASSLTLDGDSSRTMTIPFTSECGAEDGFTVADDSEQIELCPATCQKRMDDPAAQLVATLRCRRSEL